jgi:superfamily II DNA or RNA helicase
VTPLDVLRPYQREALTDLWGRWGAGAVRVPVVLATGLGKTKIGTRAVWKWRQENPGKRVLWIAHTDELIAQAAAEMRAGNPGATVGIVKAGLNETHCDIIMSSRQTLAGERRRAQLKRVGLIVIDEAHHAVRSNTYGKILEHFDAFGLGADAPTTKVLGLTATLSRGDKAKLSTVWEDCTFRRDILFGIRNGFLLDVRGERVIVPDLTMSNVKKSGGDFQDASLAEELERTFAPQIVADKYAAVAHTGPDDPRLRQGIAFWPLVETAYHGAEAFEAAGISSAVIHGVLPKEERKLILKRFAAGEITVVHNCMVLTEGFDAPWADVVVIGRPTRNGGLYQQMVGRVLRPDLTIPQERREKALILDVTGAGANNDLRCLIDLSPEHLAGKDYEDGDSLLDLEEEWLLDEESAGGSIELETEVYVGPAETVSFDPLHRKSVWGQTAGGTFFMSAGGEQYVFLGETMSGAPGTWDVVWCTKTGAFVAGGTQHVGLELEDALLWAEDEAIARGGVGAKTLAQRSSAWRRGEPSEKQKASFSYLYREGMTRGEMSEAIDASMAARRIDPFVKRMRGAST